MIMELRILVEKVDKDGVEAMSWRWS